MNKTTRLVILALIVALLASCAPADAKPALKVEFTQWWPDYAIVIAKEKGIFDKYGVNVEPIYYADFSKTVPDINAKELDGGLLSISDAMTASQYGEIKIVSTYDDGGYNLVVGNPDIATLADLKGKSIGAPVNTPYELFVHEMLRSAGLNVSDVKLVNLAPDEIAAKMRDGTIQAGYTWDPTEALNDGAQVIFTKYDAPGLFPDVIVFRAEVVKARPDDIRAFLKAWYEASQFMKDNPDEASQIIAKYLNVDVSTIYIDTEINMPDANENITLFSGIDGTTMSVQTAVKTNADFMIQAGTLRTMPNLAEFVDGSFLK